MAFFDPDDTGQVTLGQTWAGLGSLGLGAHWRVFLTPISNGFRGYLAQGKPSFRIAVAKISEGKHPFDSGSFGDDGAIDETAYTLGSWFSGKEVHLFFCIASDTTKQEDGAVVPAVTPRTLRRLYEGTLFHTLARRRRMVDGGVDVTT